MPARSKTTSNTTPPKPKRKRSVLVIEIEQYIQEMNQMELLRRALPVLEDIGVAPVIPRWVDDHDKAYAMVTNELFDSGRRLRAQYEAATLALNDNSFVSASLEMLSTSVLRAAAMSAFLRHQMEKYS